MSLLNSSSLFSPSTAGNPSVRQMPRTIETLFRNKAFALCSPKTQSITRVGVFQESPDGGLKSGERASRNYGIDLLRIASMYMVCMLHVLGQGGVLDATASNRISNEVAWFFEIAAYCAVNCFSLVSGYVGCRSSFKPRNLFRLWLQAVFYSFGIALIFRFTCPSSISLKKLFKSLFPICTGEYWYLTAYALMFFLMPQMNFLLARQPKNALRHFIWIFFGIFSVLAMISFLSEISSPVFHGYSAIWLAYLYMIGGFVRIYEASNLFPASALIRNVWGRIPFCSQTKLLLAYLLCIVVTFLLYTEGHYLLMHTMGRDPICQRFVNYNSPTILFAGLSLFVFFSRLNVTRISSFIRMASPLAFGVYLVQCQPQILWQLFTGSFKGVAELPIWLFPFAIIFISLGIYAVCSFIDYGRLRLFKLLRLS